MTMSVHSAGIVVYEQCEGEVPGQSGLLPVFTGQLIPDDYLVRVIAACVHALRSRRPAQALSFGNLNRIRSSRRLEASACAMSRSCACPGVWRRISKSLLMFVAAITGHVEADRVGYASLPSLRATCRLFSCLFFHADSTCQRQKSRIAT